MGSQESREGQNHPAGLTSDAAEDKAGILGCKGALPGHAELLVSQHSQGLQSCPQSILCPTIFVSGIALPQVLDLAFGLVELLKVHTGPPLKPVQVSLEGIPSLQHVDCPTAWHCQQLAEGVLDPIVHITAKMLNIIGPSANP